MHIQWTALALGLAAAGANVCGGLAVVRRPWNPVYLRYFIALGAGFMLAASLLEMLPESFARTGASAAILLLSGYLLIHFFEHTVSGHFHFGEETHTTEMSHPHRVSAILMGLMIHAFVDGISIATGFLVSNWLGWVIFVAVFLHKMPEGFAVSSVMMASGSKTQFALLASVLLGAATFVGVLAMNPLQGQVSYTLPFSAGVTLYVAASDLIPEVNQHPALPVPMFVFVGVLFFLLLKHIFV